MVHARKEREKMTGRRFYAGGKSPEERGPGCENCAHRTECHDAREGYFCPRWNSRVPEERKPDPNEQWQRGEDAEL